jgi:TolB protein
LFADWAPDGRRVALSTVRNGAETIVVVDLRGHLQRDLHAVGECADWSPNGRWILFCSRRTGSWNAWIMRADGSGQRRLLDLPRRDDGAPRSPPDGHWLAFDSRALGRSDLYLARADGHGLRRLRAGESPAWRPGA